MKLPLSAAQVELANLGSAQVRREHRHVDILVLIPEMRWLVLIENKIHSQESRGQLERYCQAIESDYSDWKHVAVLLTLSGDDPSDDGTSAGFIPFSHEEVAGILHELLGVEAQLPTSIRLFLLDYTETLRRLTMSDSELVQLCRDIYARHRRAIDLIVEHGISSQTGEVVRAVLEEDDPVHNPRRLHS